MKYMTTVNDQEYEIVIDHENQILVNGEEYSIDFTQLGEGGSLSLIINNRSLEAIIDEREDAWEVLIHGELYMVQVQDERAYRLARARGVLLDSGADLAIRSPMPGLILDVLVEEGDQVQAGDKVVILESMKMENELRATRDGVVLRIKTGKGESVEKNQELVIIGEPEEDE